MVDTILFDLDGTLCDLEVRYISPFREAVMAIRPDLEHDQEAVEAILDKLWSILGEKSKILILRVIWRIGGELGLNVFGRIKFMREVQRNYTSAKETFVLIEDAEQTIEYALKNFQVAIVTSAFRSDLEHGKQQIPVLNEIPVIVDSNSVKNPKPDPEPLLMALRKLGKKPKDALFIGDLPTDIIAGRRAGVETIAFGGELSEYTKDILMKEDPDYYVENHKELLNLLTKITLVPELRITNSITEINA